MQPFQLQQIFRWIGKNYSLYVSSSSITHRINANHLNIKDKNQQQKNDHNVKNLLKDLGSLLRGIQQYVQMKLRHKISVRWQPIGIFTVWKAKHNNQQLNHKQKYINKDKAKSTKATNATKSTKATNATRSTYKQNINMSVAAKQKRPQTKQKQDTKIECCLIKNSIKLTFQVNSQLKKSFQFRPNIQRKAHLQANYKFVFPQTEDMLMFVSNNFFSNRKQQYSQKIFKNNNCSSSSLFQQQSYEYVRQLNKIFAKALLDLLELDKKILIQFKFIKIFMKYGQIKYQYNKQWFQLSFQNQNNDNDNHSHKQNLFDNPVFKNRANILFIGVQKEYKNLLKQKLFPNYDNPKYKQAQLQKYRKMGQILDQKFNKLIDVDVDE